MSTTWTLPNNAFPNDAVKQMYSFLTNQAAANKRDTLDAALVVVDYGSQFVVGNTAVGGVEKLVVGSDSYTEKLKLLIEESENAVKGWTPPSWLLPLALTVLQDILKLLVVGK